MIVHDSWWSNGRACFNYHRLSLIIIDDHGPIDLGLTHLTQLDEVHIDVHVRYIFHQFKSDTGRRRLWSENK